MNSDQTSMILNWTTNEDIVKALKCSICGLVMKNPQRLLCGHSFCGHCIPLLKELCSDCCQPFNPLLVTKDILAANLIEDLQLKCDYGGCSWEGLFSEYRTHYKQSHIFSSVKSASEEQPGKRSKPNQEKGI
jgi:hypothetical protein